MELEILNFYAGKGLDLPKLIAKAPAGIDRINVEAAAIDLYKQIRGGKAIKDLNISRAVWELARKIDVSAYEQEAKELRNVYEFYKGLESRFAMAQRHTYWHYGLSAVQVATLIYIVLEVL